MLGLFLRGLLIGLSIAAQVGPMAILCIRRTLADGRQVGFISGLGIASADALYGAIGGFGLTFVSSFLIEYQVWLKLVGGIFLIYLGIKAWQTPPAELSRREYEQKDSLGKFYISTFLLTLTNPTTILSFAAIFAGLGAGSTNGDYTTASLLIGGIFAGSALWWLLLTTGVSLLRNKFTPARLSLINQLSGLIIGGFGILALISLLSLPSPES